MDGSEDELELSAQLRTSGTQAQTSQGDARALQAAAHQHGGLGVISPSVAKSSPSTPLSTPTVSPGLAVPAAGVLTPTARRFGRRASKFALQISRNQAAQRGSQDVETFDKPTSPPGAAAAVPQAHLHASGSKRSQPAPMNRELLRLTTSKFGVLTAARAGAEGGRQSLRSGRVRAEVSPSARHSPLKRAQPKGNLPARHQGSRSDRRDPGSIASEPAPEFSDQGYICAEPAAWATMQEQYGWSDDEN